MAGRSPATATTFLFVPGDRPDRFAKALDSTADIVVFDLEDAVAPDAKHRARDLVFEAARSASRSVAVRVNGTGTPWISDDVGAAIDAGAHIMLPKSESRAEIDGLGSLGAGVSVIALIETPRGIHHAAELAETASVSRLAFGSLDYAAALGVDPLHREALALARSQLVLASALGGLAGPIDGVTTDVRDERILEDDLRYARALGFSGKLCIHPAQLDASSRALRPSAEELSWALAILEIAGGAADGGVVSYEGKMVDAPVVKRARDIVAGSEPSNLAIAAEVV